MTSDNPGPAGRASDGEHRRELASSVAEVVELLAEQVEPLADAMVSQFVQQIPAFGGAERMAVLEETRRQCRANVGLFLEVARTGRSVLGSELPFLPDRLWIKVGIPLEDALQTFRIGHRCLWDAILAAAVGVAGGEDAALALARPLMDFIDTVCSAVAYAYLQAQHAIIAEQDQSRRELLESILDGRLPLSGVARSQALAHGLDESARYVVIVVSIHDEPRHATREQVLRAIRDRIDGDCSGALLVDRGHELVGLLAPRTSKLGSLCDDLSRALRHLHESRGIAVTAGMSTAILGVEGAQVGHREARRALSWAPAAPALVALPLISIVDYLVAAADDTARRIPSHAVALLAGDSALPTGTRETLRAYFACNLNARQAAERLGIHPNTMHYRLRRITDFSGADLHDFGTLVELLLALRLSEPPFVAGAEREGEL